MFERRGSAGMITLNRPKALNAVTLVMVRAMRRQLDAWRDDPAVTRVIITGAGERAFSAGGDIRQVYDLGRAGRQEEALIYWREEYALNTVIKYYPKPYVALLDGIVMGGGVGVSIHGSHRVAGDKFLFAMPEVNIGFFPGCRRDLVPAAHAGRIRDLVRADRRSSARRRRRCVGRCDAPGSVFAISGIARRALFGNVSVDAILGAFSQCRARVDRLRRCRGEIDRLFAADTCRSRFCEISIAPHYPARPRGLGAATATTIRTRSPTSVKLRWRKCGAARTMTFEECMRTEFRIVSRIVYGEDFYEGVRAVIVDKDNAPRWQPATLAEVSRCRC